MFYTLPETISTFSVTFMFLSATALNFDWSKILSLGNELRNEISLPNEKISDWSNLKTFVGYKKNVAHVLGKVENIVGKGENAGYQHFLLFPKCFQKPFSFESLKPCIEC